MIYTEMEKKSELAMFCVMWFRRLSSGLVFVSESTSRTDFALQRCVNQRERVSFTHVHVKLCRKQKHLDLRTNETRWVRRYKDTIASLGKGSLFHMHALK